MTDGELKAIREQCEDAVSMDAQGFINNPARAHVIVKHALGLIAELELQVGLRFVAEQSAEVWENEVERLKAEIGLYREEVQFFASAFNTAMKMIDELESDKPCKTKFRTVAGVHGPSGLDCGDCVNKQCKEFSKSGDTYPDLYAVKRGTDLIIECYSYESKSDKP